MARTYVRGGAKLRKFIRNAARSSRAPQATAEAGFVEPHVARLAARLEFGDVRNSLPERPAFRVAAPDALAAGSRIVAESLGSRVRDGVFVVDRSRRATRRGRDGRNDPRVVPLGELRPGVRTPSQAQGRDARRGQGADRA